MNSERGAAAAALRWLGHAAFLLTSPGGTRLLIDPFDASVGYPIPQLPPTDLVVVTHEHADHTNTAMAPGDPKVVRGLSADGWRPSVTDSGDVRVTLIGGAYHDEERGRRRGRTAFASIEAGGLRILHLGDLGHRLDTNLRAQCQGHDVVLVPVGGFYTIDGATAGAVIDDLAPAIAVPMHYRTAHMPGHPTAPLADSGFLDGRTVRRLDSPEVTLAPRGLPARLEIMVPAVPGTPDG